MGRYTLLGTMIILVPLMFFTIYTLFFSQPRQDAYVESGESFLKQKYSEVIDRLENYDPKNMPYVVQYELAKSYVTYEPLEESLRKMWKMQSLCKPIASISYIDIYRQGHERERDRFGENHGGSRIDYVWFGKSERTD